MCPCCRSWMLLQKPNARHVNHSSVFRASRLTLCRRPPGDNGTRKKRQSKPTKRSQSNRQKASEGLPSATRSELPDYIPCLPPSSHSTCTLHTRLNTSPERQLFLSTPALPPPPLPQLPPPVVPVVSSTPSSAANIRGILHKLQPCLTFVPHAGISLLSTSAQSCYQYPSVLMTSRCDECIRKHFGIHPRRSSPSLRCVPPDVATGNHDDQYRHEYPGT